MKRGGFEAMVHGTVAGGGFDLYTRVFVNHFAKYVPGNPNIVVKNMPGATGLVAINYLANTAPRDGASLLAFTAMSNVLGTVNDVPTLVAAAHAHGAAVLVDACQSIPHEPVDVTAWGADFVAFSGHKMMGPTGIGGLWAPRAVLEAMPPFLGGGEMIRDVRKDGFTTNDVPWKFEAGTPAIAEAVGLGAAVTWLEGIGMDAIADHERRLTAYALERLTDALGDAITIYGPATAEGRGSAISFLVDGIHAHDISQVLDEDAVCVRAGHHCAKPLMRLLGVNATARASFYLYNDQADVDALADALDGATDIFGS